MTPDLVAVKRIRLQAAEICGDSLSEAGIWERWANSCLPWWHLV